MYIQRKFFLVIIQCYPINKLSDYYIINIKFCYMDDNIQIIEDKDENFVITESLIKNVY